MPSLGVMHRTGTTQRIIIPSVHRKEPVIVKLVNANVLMVTKGMPAVASSAPTIVLGMVNAVPRQKLLPPPPSASSTAQTA
jgi:hypothetical protein